MSATQAQLTAMRRWIRSAPANKTYTCHACHLRDLSATACLDHLRDVHDPDVAQRRRQARVEAHMQRAAAQYDGLRSFLDMPALIAL